MPSRNKRNKNRPNANTTSGVNAPRTAETAAAETTDDLANNAIIGKDAEASQIIASTITEAKEKLAELQQSVDSIKSSLGQASASTSTLNANAEASSEVRDEKQSEQQTMKKKRNRNRNRKMNLSNAGESGVSSHESSPTHAAPITLTTQDVITAKIIEEPNQSECNASLEKIQSDCIETKPVEAPTEQIVKAIVDEQQANPGEASSVEIFMDPSETNAVQFKTENSNTEKIDTNLNEIKIIELPEKIDGKQTAVEEVSTKDKEPATDKTLFRENEKLEKPYDKNAEPDDRSKLIDPTSTDKKTKVVSQTEKIEEVKDAIGGIEMKQNFPDAHKHSPKVKNKTNNNKNGKEAKKGEPATDKTLFRENEKLEKPYDKNAEPDDKSKLIDPTPTDEKTVESQSEKVEEFKDAIGAIEIKQNLPEAHKHSPKVKNNNKNGKEAKKDDPAMDKTQFRENEKLQESQDKNAEPNDKPKLIDPPPTDPKLIVATPAAEKSKIESQTEKVEEVKDAIGGIEMKQNFPNAHKHSPKVKNKTNNNKNGKEAKKDVPAMDKTQFRENEKLQESQDKNAEPNDKPKLIDPPPTDPKLIVATPAAEKSKIESQTEKVEEIKDVIGGIEMKQNLPEMDKHNQKVKKKINNNKNGKEAKKGDPATDEMQFRENKKVQESQDKNAEPNDKHKLIDPTPTDPKLIVATPTDEKSKIESQTEKVEEFKDVIGGIEMKQNLPEMDKHSATVKNKMNNNKNGKEAKKAAIVNRKIEKRPVEQIKSGESDKQIKPAEQSALSDSKTAQMVEVDIVNSVEESVALASELAKAVIPSSTIQSENVIRTPTSTPIITTPAPELSKKQIQQEDETAKIWKILEEASKSLEPVEIKMDDEPMINANDPPPIEINKPILGSSKKQQQQIEEKAKDLVALLETKESDTLKTNTESKPTADISQSGAKPKQRNPTKAIDCQPQKCAEPMKKDTESLQKSPKSNKPIQQPVHTDVRESPVEKLTAEKHEQMQEMAQEKLVEKSLTINEISDSTLTDDDEIPLDVSILPDHIDVPEINTDSKNVQGSDFVPSVEQTTAETKSLVPDTIAQSNETESNINDSEHPNKKIALQPLIEQTQDDGSLSSASKKKSKKDDLKNQTEVSAQSMSQQRKRPNDTGKSNQTNFNKKNVQDKVSLNSVKSNGKPTVPPKPDNLVSSQMKKSQAVTTKSSKMEKILVLTGTNADDEDSEDDYIEYKFMPRQVFIATICQSCKKPVKLIERILCQLCQMVAYCSVDHVAKDEPQHKDLCAAFQEIAKKRGGHIYNNARILNDNDYRSLRVYTLNLCENFLKRPLQTYEREILLFPRLCSKTSCREWRPNMLADCDGCGQAFYCSAQPDHLIGTHQRWCESVGLYRNLVVRQSLSGRIEPSLPSRIQNKPYILPNTFEEVFKDLYKNCAVIKDECVFATLTQLATAPLTAYFATQIAELKIGEQFTIHLIGAELQFEADVLDIWETFFLHLAHNLVELTIVFCGPELNAENIPLDIISRIRMCRTCRQHCRIVKFDFQCAKFYHDYAKSTAYSKPDLICFFNPGFHHINSLNGFDTWSETIQVASMADCPVVVTSYTEYESPRDLDRFQHETSKHGKQLNLIHGPSLNAYASQRPERNFISDEIVPLIFKNYFCFVLK